MKQESPNFSPKLSRRELFKLSGAALGTILLGGCDLVSSPPPKEELTPIFTPKPSSSPTREPTITRTPEPTVTPTRMPESTRTPTPESTLTPTPEPPKFLETIKVDIPGLTVERYAVKFQEITNEVPESDRRDIEEWVAQPEFRLADNNSRDQSPKENLERVWNRLWPVTCQFGQSFVTWGEIRPNHDRELFYYDGEGARFYTNIFATDAKGYIASDVDKKILNCEQDARYYPFYDRICMSRSGKILYPVILDQSLADSKLPREAVIIADIPNGTKTVIKDSQLRLFDGDLTHDGDKLLVGLPAAIEAERGQMGMIYLLDLNTWQIQFQTPLRVEPYWDERLLNENGSRLYINSTGYIFNTLTGEKEPVLWPTFLSSFWAAASPNLNYIVRGLGMFPAGSWVEGQWGIMAYTPDGFFMINSPDWSWPPYKVDNDGTIYTNRSDIFKFEGETYKLVKTGLEAQFKTKDSGKPIEVRVTKVGGR